jgi:hypothetical protein
MVHDYHNGINVIIQDEYGIETNIYKSKFRYILESDNTIFPQTLKNLYTDIGNVIYKNISKDDYNHIIENKSDYKIIEDVLKKLTDIHIIN